jgi:hypothetical protein
MALIQTFFPVKKVLFTGLCLLLLGTAYAQQEAPVKEALPTGTPAVATEAPAAPENPAVAPQVEAPHRPGLRFGLNAGTMFAGRLGGASYLEPTAFYDLSKRFRVFGSMTYMHLMQPAFGRAEPGNSAGAGSLSSNRVMVQVGGQYDASEKLTLTGSIWRDLSALSSSYQPYRNPFAPGGSGVSFRADLKISEHLSISGGVRYGNGNRNGFGHPFYSPYYSPSFGY